MQLRLISWFFITLNFMEYIGSQHASRVRRQGRSKCEEIYTLITSASSPCAVHLSGGFSWPRCPRAGKQVPRPRRGRADLPAASPSWRDEGGFRSLSASLSPRRDEQRWLREDLRLLLYVLMPGKGERPFLALSISYRQSAVTPQVTFCRDALSAFLHPGHHLATWGRTEREALTPRSSSTVIAVG